ncbi:Zn-dependent hydrolase [Alkalicoccobacillus murimartini]|uniref:N-carbamoyl-L-amino-acid hydrolase n=1 Tax=Alkalicoccobacillus murimartini TaxID=171685 RepID=A0ABT9YHD1_9BACI|nr:Zn-dependent hydrolase [Alkalicoccobacillus murimartini]MDQ0207276.1 N-carbamoyl-L-amino-acid hydrolase [Alkalicoccobacillus murimartini]
MKQQKIAINGQQLQKTLEDFAEFGATDRQGVTRLALSEEDVWARDYFRNQCEELGLYVTVDDLGNMYSTLEGVDRNKPAIYIGSHLDSVKRGGRFDGVLGVAAGLEVIRSIVSHNLQPACSIVIVNFTNEEGARFEPSMMASGVLSGKFEKESMCKKVDTEGISFGDALKRTGYEGSIEHRMSEGKAFLELHIEQGPILEAESLQIGAVECVVGMVCYEIEIQGESNHAGTTPQHMRKDALTAANHCMSEFHTRLSELDETLVYTMGRFNVYPNIHTVIPNRVVFSLEARHQDETVLAEVENIIKKLMDQQQGECTQSAEKLWSRDTVWFESTIVQSIQKSAKTLNYTSKRMVSGAGHDAQFIASMVPTAMIFVPSAGGKSHDEDEYTSWEECERGVNVLLETVLELSESE